MNCIRSVLSIEIARCWPNLDCVNVCLCRLNLCQAHTSSPVPPLYIAQTSYQLHDQPASPYRCLNMAVHSQESITVSAIVSRVWSILNLYILYGMGNDWFANKFRCLTDLPPPLFARLVADILPLPPACCHGYQLKLTQTVSGHCIIIIRLSFG